MKDVWRLYDDVASQFARDRRSLTGEDAYLERIVSQLSARARVLDLGCGSGSPIARFFMEKGFEITGVDAAPAMIALCRENFPDACWVTSDMRTLALDGPFDAIIAWDSFFHLPHEDQRAMFAVFRRHSAPQGFLLFTTGTTQGVAMGSMYGRDLYHASLDTDEYSRLLAEHGFDVLIHRVEDPNCGSHTIWLAQSGD